MAVMQYFLCSCACGLTVFCVGLARAAEEPSPADFPEGYVAEAPLPEGFPAPSDPGVVVEKSYPGARSYSATGSAAFMKCFTYLSANSHKMTAPVVMDLPADDKAAESPSEQSAVVAGAPVPMVRMHFLLEEKSLDKPQQVGDVQVADIPALRVLSIAFRGEATTEKVQKGKQAIAARLAKMPNTQKAGDYRLLGYNSPMVDRDKNFWELQLPIKEKTASQ